MLDRHYAKTEVGRAEIKARSLVSSRVARNLLLVLDASKTAREWIGMVQGATESDFQLLLSHGLVAAPTVPGGGPVPARALDGSALPTLSHEQLYAYLTRHAKQYLGLIKGYRVVLDVERCSGLAELQTYALRFVDMVEEAQGEEAALQVRLALGLRV